MTSVEAPDASSPRSTVPPQAGLHDEIAGPHRPAIFIFRRRRPLKRNARSRPERAFENPLRGLLAAASPAAAPAAATGGRSFLALGLETVPAAAALHGIGVLDAE